jgi:hypothetical protein
MILNSKCAWLRMRKLSYLSFVHVETGLKHHGVFKYTSITLFIPTVPYLSMLIRPKIEKHADEWRFAMPFRCFF